MNTTETMTAAEVAEALRCDVRTVHNLRSSGKLPAEHYGPKMVRYRRADVEAFRHNSLSGPSTLNSDMNVSLFNHAFTKNPSKAVGAIVVLRAIRDGKWADKIERLRKIRDKKEFTKFKRGLPGFTVTGTFNRRNDTGLEAHSGLLQVDIDGKDNIKDGKPMDYDETWETVVNCPYVLGAFKSPSGKGIKALIKCPPDRGQHIGSYKAAAEWFADKGITVDTQVCALSQLCFVSWDPNTFINPKAKAVSPVYVDKREAVLEEFEEHRSQDEILRECGERYGNKFSDLWEGDYEQYTDDHSVADFRLIAMLRDNCHSNEMVAEMFAESGLARPEKWGGRTRDYVFRTLAKTETVKVLSMFEVIPDDPEDPAPKKKMTSWGWDAVCDIADWKPENENYVIKNLLYARTSACIFGPSGSGKTFCVFDLAAAITTGTMWQGHRVIQGAVLYFGLEGHHGVTKRIQAMRNEGKLTNDSNFARVVFNRTSMNLLKDDHVTKAKETIEAYEIECGMRVRLVIIDTLARATPGGDENSSKDMGVAAVNALAIAERTGAAVLIVHHSGKNQSLGMRGSTALPAAFDSIYEVTRYEKNRDFRVFRVKKQRDDTDTAQLYFQLKVVGLGEDYDGDMVTSCLVDFLPPGKTPEDRDEDVVLHSIGEGGREGRTMREISEGNNMSMDAVDKVIKGLGSKVVRVDRKYYLEGYDAPEFEEVEDNE